MSKLTANHREPWRYLPSVWRGNAAKSDRFVTDCHLMIDSSALYNYSTGWDDVRLQSSVPGIDGEFSGTKDAEGCLSTWERCISGERIKIMLSNLRAHWVRCCHLGPHCIPVDIGGAICDLRYVKWLLDLGVTEAWVATPDKPVVFAIGGVYVAALMPLNMDCCDDCANYPNCPLWE